MGKISMVHVISVALYFACVNPSTSSAPEPAALTTDSTVYTVQMSAGWYHANIGFAYQNGAARSLSANYCRTPSPPALEKYESGKWVLAYSPFIPMCLSMPPFVVPADSSYHGILDFTAARPNEHKAPDLRVDSIPGIYRLRWVLRAGSDPNAKDAPMVEAISNTFRFLLEQP